MATVVELLVKPVVIPTASLVVATKYSVVASIIAMKKDRQIGISKVKSVKIPINKKVKKD